MFQTKFQYSLLSTLMISSNYIAWKYSIKNNIPIFGNKTILYLKK